MIAARELSLQEEDGSGIKEANHEDQALCDGQKVEALCRFVHPALSTQPRRLGHLTWRISVGSESRTGKSGRPGCVLQPAQATARRVPESPGGGEGCLAGSLSAYPPPRHPPISRRHHADRLLALRSRFGLRSPRQACVLTRWLERSRRHELRRACPLDAPHGLRALSRGSCGGFFAYPPGRRPALRAAGVEPSRCQPSDRTHAHARLVPLARSRPDHCSRLVHRCSH